MSLRLVRRDEEPERMREVAEAMSVEQWLLVLGGVVVLELAACVGFLWGLS
jgi:hypothetical protein